MDVVGLRRSCPVGPATFTSPREFTTALVRKSYAGPRGSSRQPADFNATAPPGGVIDDWGRSTPDGEERIFIADTRRRRHVSNSRLLYSRQGRHTPRQRGTPRNDHQISPGRKDTRRRTPRLSGRRATETPPSPACRAAIACAQQQRSRHGEWFERRTDDDAESVLDSLERRLGNTSAGLSALHRLIEYTATSGSSATQVQQEQKELMQQLIKNHMETFSSLAEMRTSGVSAVDGRDGKERLLSPPLQRQATEPTISRGRLHLASTHKSSGRYATPPIRNAAPQQTSASADGGEDPFPAPPQTQAPDRQRLLSPDTAGTVTTGSSESIADEVGCNWLGNSDNETVVHHSGSDGDDEVSSQTSTTETAHACSIAESREWRAAHSSVQALVHAASGRSAPDALEPVLSHARALLAAMEKTADADASPARSGPLPPCAPSPGLPVLTSPPPIDGPRGRLTCRALDPDLVCGDPSDEDTPASTCHSTSHTVARRGGSRSPRRRKARSRAPGSGTEHSSAVVGDLMPLSALGGSPTNEDRSPARSHVSAPALLDGGETPPPPPPHSTMCGDKPSAPLAIPDGRAECGSDAGSRSAEEGDCEWSSVSEDVCVKNARRKAEAAAAKSAAETPPDSALRSPLMHTIRGKIVTPRSSLRRKRRSVRSSSSPAAVLDGGHSPLYARSSAAGGGATVVRTKGARRRQRADADAGPRAAAATLRAANDTAAAAVSVAVVAACSCPPAPQPYFSPHPPCPKPLATPHVVAPPPLPAACSPASDRVSAAILGAAALVVAAACPQRVSPVAPKLKVATALRTMHNARVPLPLKPPLSS
eukprot:TRINITY_DN39535_c0_g1_i1.p1 TRINITY_DN39535_c0_g1~~TRINITY_DN39535_c0_g1_i1.p1  ORF type:complete len:823 (+),score=238.17 TRINITY_DN39535_c0_g1_i1:73-2541(+)